MSDFDRYDEAWENPTAGLGERELEQRAASREHVLDDLGAKLTAVIGERDQARAEWAAAAQQVVNLTAELAELAEEGDRLRAALRDMLYIFDRELDKGTVGRRACDDARATLASSSTTPTPPPG